MFVLNTALLNTALIRVPRFLWVSYQLDDIYEQPSTEDIRAILASLPADMHGTYIRILRLIGQQHKSLKEVVRRVLMWVVSAERPLSLEELAVAVAITPECRTFSDICGRYQTNTVIEACSLSTSQTKTSTT